MVVYQLHVHVQRMHSAPGCPRAPETAGVEVEGAEQTPKAATQLAETGQPTWAGYRSEQARRRLGYSAEDPDRRESGDPRAEEGNQMLLAVEAVPE